MQNILNAKLKAERTKGALECVCYIWEKHNCLWISWWSAISYILKPQGVLIVSRRGNSTNQKDYKTLSARLCKCFHSYKIHFCSQFVLYIHQIGRFYIGWMDNINSSPSLIETISKTLGNVYVFHRLTSWRKVQRHFMKIHELLIWSTPVLYISEALRIWIESYLKATKKGKLA